MSIPIVCDSCGHFADAADHQVGKRVRCPKCKAAVFVPDDQAVSQPVSPSPPPPPRRRPKERFMEEEAREKRGMSGWQIAAIAAGGSVVVTFMVCVGLIFLIGHEAQSAKRPAISRSQFRAACEEKTPGEIVQALGRPDSTMEHSDGSESWSYRGRTFDPNTGNIDFSASLSFDKRTGKCERVSFH